MNTIRFLAMSFLFLMAVACEPDAVRTTDPGSVALADALPAPTAQSETVNAECDKGQEGVCACDSDRCACGCEKKEGRCACGCNGDGDRDKCGCRGEDGQCNCNGDCPHRGEDGKCGCGGHGDRFQSL